MRRASGLFAVCVSTGLLAWAQAPTPSHRVELEDPMGDVESAGEHPDKDVVKVVLDSDGSGLLVEATLAEPVRHYLEGHLAGAVVALVIDTDANDATGGNLAFGKKLGFDMEVEVRACIEYEGGEACVGGLGDLPIKGFFSSFTVGRFPAGEPFATSVHEPLWKSSRTPIEGAVVTAAIPYEELGVVSGQTLRIAVRESDAGMFERAYMPDVLLRLK